MSIGVNIEWEIFDWGRKKREIAEKESTTKQAQNNLREIENAVLLDVNRHYRKLQEACQLLRVTQMGKETARINLQMSFNRYRSQINLLKDVLQTQAALADYEAIFLVVIVALIGFWEWRSALLMALSVPLTLLMTFGMMHILGIDIQQVSIASLIIALGLLVDDPVVAGDAIKRELGAGHTPLIAAWLGPTKLAKAILYATITNIVAYIPFLLLIGDTGTFIYSL